MFTTRTTREQRRRRQDAIGWTVIAVSLLVAAFLAGAAWMDASAARPREVVCDNPTFEPIPNLYPAHMALCNDGIRVVILD